MCGIVGKVSFGNINKIHDEKIIKTMLDALAHRGPDAEGIFSDKNVVFGHRRLSIIDTSETANQPMLSNDKDIVLAFNGEIYNYLEIRKELERKYPFRTNHSDTEAIIYAYKEWGIDCIKKFNGFFAIALYDRKLQKVYLIRDRLGKKPLYYVIRGNSLYFSSEIHPFFNARIKQKEPNEEAIYHYLTFLTVNSPNTFYKSIFKLESGHYIELSKNNIKKIQYWNIADYINQVSEDSYYDAISKTEELLIRSMRYRNISDVKVSVALSGGLDSSLNLYFAKKYSDNLNNAINISYTIKSEFDESEVARKFANSLHINLINRKIGEADLSKLISEYLAIQKDTPIGDPNTVLLYFISKVTRDTNSKVLLVGEGGDEIGGYPYYINMQKEFRIIRNFKFLEKVHHYLPFKLARKLSVFFKGNIIPRRHIHGFTEYEKKLFWLGSKDLNSYEILYNYAKEIRDDLEDSFLRKVLNIEYKLRLPELILSRVDYPSMAVSVEARSPFMDYKLIEYSVKLPFNIKMRYSAKSILKEIAKKYLPKYILNHPKVGFGMLLTPFLKETMPVWFKKELIESETLLHKYISKRFLENLLNEHKKRKNNGYRMWIFYALNKWIKVNEFD